jgi:hypothetical protein
MSHVAAFLVTVFLRAEVVVGMCRASRVMCHICRMHYVKYVLCIICQMCIMYHVSYR